MESVLSLLKRRHEITWIILRNLVQIEPRWSHLHTDEPALD